MMLRYYYETHVATSTTSDDALARQRRCATQPYVQPVVRVNKALR